jgi:hypothetical protein
LDSSQDARPTLLADDLHDEGWNTELSAENKLRLDRSKLGQHNGWTEWNRITLWIKKSADEFDAKPEVSRDIFITCKIGLT